MKELFNKISKNDGDRIELISKLENNILLILSESLRQDAEDLAIDYIIEIEGSEFIINQRFGNIDMSEINEIQKCFLEKGYELYCISDTQTKSKMKGLVLYFRRKAKEQTSEG